MTGHKWKKDRDGAESCEREVCTVRRFGPAWQRKKGTPWHKTQNTPIPLCTGKEAGEWTASFPHHALDTMAERLGAKPAPSPLEVVRAAIAYAPDGLQNMALLNLATLEEYIRKDEREKCARELECNPPHLGECDNGCIQAYSIRNRK